ncbi:dual specificity mitogen-activated protein kinase kinase 6-like [Sycon ciliatum]|uniref:dual specificity mitogen-activated protein kinase kinase 6-like n=1 Tax=Sycon ciliatum TaxID=27933 RepID=UPI0031F64E1A
MAEHKLKFKGKGPGLAPIVQPKRQEVKPPRDLDSVGMLKFEDGGEVEVRADDLIEVKELGRGTYGAVYEMHHNASNHTMAVKRIRCTVDSKEEKRLLMDLDISKKAAKCPYTIFFYGALFRDGDVWICMEKMNHSLDVLYKSMRANLDKVIPEDAVGKVAFSVVSALEYLKNELDVIHRDVKPSNILIDKTGSIKLCDFGISGQLVNSVAKTLDAGCKPYMAPERIDPTKDREYDVRSDVWSLGVTLIELALGKFPYPPWKTVFEQLKAVVSGPAPELPDNGTFTDCFIDFARVCLMKNPDLRPKYEKLETHAFFLKYKESDYDVGTWYRGILEELERFDAQSGATAGTSPKHQT